MNTTIASLQATVAAQAVAVAALQTTTAGFDLCGAMTINSDTELALLAPATRTCDYIGGNLVIQSAVSNGTLLAVAFPNLWVVTANLLIINNPNLISLDRIFPQLQTVGSNLRIYSNERLDERDLPAAPDRGP